MIYEFIYEERIAEVNAVLGRRPGLAVMKAADGAKDNWTFMDFYHAAEQLKAALDAAYGENDPKGHSRYNKPHHVLREGWRRQAHPRPDLV